MTQRFRGRRLGTALLAGVVAVLAPVTAGTSPSVVSAAPPDSADTGSEQHYVVRFDDALAGDDVGSAWALAGAQSSLARRGARIDDTLRHVFPGAVIRADPRALAALRADPRVVEIEPVAQWTLATTQVNPPWGVDRVDQRQQPLSGSFTGQGTGAGVRVYVVDSGINPNHVDFGARVVAGYDAFSLSGDGRRDCNGHGTHVAGTVGGATFGVAKQATLVPVRIGECGDSVTSGNIVRGLDWLIGEHRRVGGRAVVNLSLGGDGSRLLDQAVAEALEAGMVVVAAAGNSGGEACEVSPARSPATLTVSASDRNDVRPIWANDGECVDLFAPGDDIVSASNQMNNGSRVISGTSMAAPHVSGAAAVLRGARPSWTARQVMAALITHASTDVVSNAGSRSPNRLLYLDPVATPLPAPPANDQFSRAAVLSTGPSTVVTGTNVLATAEPGEPRHNGTGGGQSIWWRFTAPANGRVTLSTRGSNFDTILAVYRGSAVSSLTEVISNDDVIDGIDRVSEVSFDAISDVSYHVALDGWEGSWGSIRLSMTTPWTVEVEPPPTPPSATSGMITTLRPARILDTRTTGTRITTTPTRLRITGRNNIPTTGVAAVALNITATQTTGTGYVTVYPCGTPPNTSNLNYTLGQDIPNAVIAPLSTNGDLCITANTPTHLLIDLSAWFG